MPATMWRILITAIMKLHFSTSKTAVSRKELSDLPYRDNIHLQESQTDIFMDLANIMQIREKMRKIMMPISR